MNFNSLFIVLIYALIFVLLVWIVKVKMQTETCTKMAQAKFLSLQNNFTVQEKKQKRSNEDIIMIENFYDSLLSHLFKITKEILLVQKLIFKKHN